MTANTLLWEGAVKWMDQQGLGSHVSQTICSDSYQRQDEAMALAQQILTAERLRQTYGLPVEILELPRSGSGRRHAVPLL